MKRTLKRESKVLEIVEREAILSWWFLGGAEIWGWLQDSFLCLPNPAAPPVSIGFWRGRNARFWFGLKLIFQFQSNTWLMPLYSLRPRNFQYGAAEELISSAPVDGCWLTPLNRPVLKHGPRSLTCVRVSEYC